MSFPNENEDDIRQKIIHAINFKEDIDVMPIYGVPYNLIHHTQVVKEVAACMYDHKLIDFSDAWSVIEQAKTYWSKDMEIARASGRWEPNTPDPKVYLPGDIVALRAIGYTSDLVRLSNVMVCESNANAHYVLAPYFATYYSRNYYMPSSAIQPLLDATAPDDNIYTNIILPAPIVSVWFGEDIVIPSQHLVTEEDLEVAEKYYGQFNSNAPIYTSLQRDISLAGITLFADNDNHPADTVIWHLALPFDDKLDDKNRVLPNEKLRADLVGFQSRSKLESLLRVLVTTVAYGSWTPPREQDRPEMLGGSNKYTKTNAFKRRERSGVFCQTHILNLDATIPSIRNSNAVNQTTHLSPVPHWRKPHIRRVRVGQKDSWHYETREITGTQVLPHGPVRSGLLVWNIPEVKTSSL